VLGRTAAASAPPTPADTTGLARLINVCGPDGSTQRRLPRPDGLHPSTYRPGADRQTSALAIPSDLLDPIRLDFHSGQRCAKQQSTVARLAEHGLRTPVFGPDLGRTFVEDIPIYEHTSAQAERGQSASAVDYLQDMELWTFGRVEAISGGDGTVWVVYYAGNAQATGIHWARLATSETP
jgi:hypothetical protein